MLIFWTFAFPIILGTFFAMAFSGIEEKEKSNPIPIAVVEEKENKNIKAALETLSDEKSENQIFNLQYKKEEEAKELLKNNEIDGYILLNENLKIVIRSSGINETILKYVMEEIKQQEEVSKSILEKKMEDWTSFTPDFYQNIEKEIQTILENNEANINNISSENLSYTMIEYYTLIAMTCLYGGILGMVAINQNLANMSNTGKRISVSPIRKSKLLLSSICASFLTQLIGIALLFFYTIFVLKVDYGNNILLVIFLAVVGSLAGLALGISVAAVLKTNENTKTGIILSITMAGCFLSGMMGISMKYIIDKNIPFLNKINPASRITDGFYSLYYDESFNRYIGDIISLLLFAILLFIITAYTLRRQKYDNI